MVARFPYAEKTGIRFSYDLSCLHGPVVRHYPVAVDTGVRFPVWALNSTKSRSVTSGCNPAEADATSAVEIWFHWVMVAHEVWTLGSCSMQVRFLLRPYEKNRTRNNHKSIRTKNAIENDGKADIKNICKSLIGHLKRNGENELAFKIIKEYKQLS